MISAVIFIVGVFAGVGLLAGGVIALAVLIWAQGMDSALRLISNGYFLVVGLMPVALWLAIFASYKEAEYVEAYATLLRSLLTTLQGALIGSLLGAGPIFLAVVIYVPVIILRYPIESFGPSVRDAIVWSHLLLAVGAALISAFPLGLWAYHTGSGREAN